MLRTRYGSGYPILLSMLKDQQGEMEQLSFLLYTQGLTTEPIGEVFEQLYAHHYTKQSIARLAHTVHQEVLDWLDRPLDPYYPVVYIDCPLRQGSTVSPGSYLYTPGRQSRPEAGSAWHCMPSERKQPRMAGGIWQAEGARRQRDRLSDC